jgi:uncharacterized protein (TIGR02246 family)
LFTSDGVLVIAAGTVFKGQDAIKQFYVKYFDGPGQKVSDFASSVDEVRLLGDGAWAIGTTTFTTEGKEVKAHWAATYRQNDGKLRADMLLAGVNSGALTGPQK